MARTLRHLILTGLGQSRVFKGPLGRDKRPSDVPNRAAHAQALLALLNQIPSPEAERRPGVYLEINGRAGEPLRTKSLDASGLQLLTYRPPKPGENVQAQAAVFATPEGLRNLKSKITAFENQNHPKTGRPRNADLVQSLGAVVEASLRVLWRSPQNRFPVGPGVQTWEVWLDRETSPSFMNRAHAFGLVISDDRIVFPDDLVILVHATQAALALAVKNSAEVKALAAPVSTAAFFEDLPVQEQQQWANSLLNLTTFTTDPNAGRLTILDTGVSIANPLIAPALAAADRHAARPEWSRDDNQGHGTQMAGLALWGDLTGVLQSNLPVHINYHLESVKIIPDAGANPHHLLGDITRNGVNAAETAGTFRRTFVMASTTKDDTPHDGAPTSWSGVLDQLTSGVIGQVRTRRLMVVSAGNSDQMAFTNTDYLPVCDHEDNELESPAHAWNVIAVGAYTTKTIVPGLAALAPAGDLSPSSRTASWAARWPLKPDVVLEGGNWVVMNPPPHLTHEALSLLTTSRAYPLRTFTILHDTSAATALAGKALSELWSEYPSLWPETIRAMFVSSARWTPRMVSHLPPNPPKGAYTPLFQRYGYGVPDMERARRSASNALSLIVQDTITPYKTGAAGAQNHAHNEMKSFSLPWPVQALRRLGARPVKLRVALSTFIVPNPSEAARGSRYSYASHNLRFKLRRADETDSQFYARINREADVEDEGGAPEGNDGWDFGSRRRDVGSLHIDEMVCAASDLAQRDLLVVHPVSGWWKLKTTPAPENLSAAFSLIIEIDAGENQIDLYTEITQQIVQRNLLPIVG